MKNSSQKKIPRIGVAAVLIQDHFTLLGKRLGSHGAGSWAFPGGHLEYGESIIDCAIRELFEETGLKGKASKIMNFSESITDDNHHVTFFVMIDSFEGEVQLLEPHKCEGWKWCNINELPTPLFSTVEFLFEKNSRL